MKTPAYNFTSILFGCLAVLTFVVFLPFAIRGVDPHHDGLMLKTALDVLSGQTLFTETFTQYGPLNVYIQTLILWIFGSTLLALKVGTAAIYSVSFFILLLIWRKFLPLSLTVLAGFMWLLFVPFFYYYWPLLPWSSSYALFFQSLTMLALTQSISSEKHHSLLALTCGVFCALTAWCRVPVGLSLFAAVSLSYFLVPFFLTPSSKQKNFKLLRYFIVGVVAVHAVFLIHLWMNHSILDWYFHVFVLPARWIKNGIGGGLMRIVESLFFSYRLGIILCFFIVASFLPAHVPFLLHQSKRVQTRIKVGYLIVWAAIFFGVLRKHPGLVDTIGGWATAIPVFLLFFVASFLIDSTNQHTNDKKKFFALSCSLIGLSSWLQYYPTVCFRHVFWAISPALGPAIYVSYVVSKRNKWIVLTVFLILLFPLAQYKFLGARTNLRSDYVKLNEPPILRGLYARSDVAEVILSTWNAIHNYYKDHPNSPVLLESPDALYGTFFPILKNPVPMFVSWGVEVPEWVQKKDSFIRTQKPLVFFQDRSDSEIDSYIHKYNYISLFKRPGYQIIAPK
jgi:hypothetical protein